MFSGSIVALITPFQKGNVDLEALSSLVEWHICSGTQAIVACGTTGEGFLLTPKERQEVIRTILKAAQKRIPVIIGCGAPSTWEAIALVKEAEQLGAQASLVVSPYYVKPNQEGLFEHFKAVAEASSLPLVVYNNPGRSGVEISVETLSRLAKIPTVVGLKDSSCDGTRLIELRQNIRPYRPDFVFLSGDDPTVSSYLANGGDGCISITANLVPKQCQDFMKAFFDKDETRFCSLRDALLPLHKALLLETNPSPVKYGVSHLGYAKNEMRLPLMPIQTETEQKILYAFDSIQRVEE